jgi:ketosteroid isomerase-like protein
MTTAIDDVLTSWVDAERRGDARALDALLTDGFERGLHYAALGLDEASTRTYGQTALVVAHQHADGDHRGNPTPADLRLSITLVRDGRAWRTAGIHHSFMAETTGPA